MDYDRETGEYMNAPVIVPHTHRWSAETGELFAALAKAQANVKAALKDNTNPHFKSRYADLSSVRDACWEALTAQGICIVQMPVNGAGNNIGVVTLFGHSSGQWIESSIFVAPGRFDAQGAGGVITYLRRYALAAMAGVAPEDDDGNAAVAGPAQGRAGASQAHESAPRGGYARNRVEAAPAPSADDTEAKRLIRMVQDQIGRAETFPEIDGILNSRDWADMEKALKACQPEKTVLATMDMMHLRIDRQKALLTGEMG